MVVSPNQFERPCIGVLTEGSPQDRRGRPELRAARRRADLQHTIKRYRSDELLVDAVDKHFRSGTIVILVADGFNEKVSRLVETLDVLIVRPPIGPAGRRHAALIADAAYDAGLPVYALTLDGVLVRWLRAADRVASWRSN